ncbi:hypothetical protein FRB90_007616, partial [Tulasnella sp. 427]
AVIEGTPAVWSYITATEPLPCIKRAVELVQDSPIDFEYNDNEAKYAVEAFLQAAASRMAQWRSVVLLVSSYGVWSLGPLKEKLPPNLEKLQITRHRAIPMNRTYTLFEGQPAPRTLRDIRLHFVPIAVAPLFLSESIATLELDGLVVVSVEEILRILQACPSLRSLELGLLELSAPAPSVLERYPEIQLPRLEHFEIRLLEDSLTRALLRTIQMPNVRTIILPIQVQHNNERMLDFLAGSADSLTSAIHRIISTVNSFEIWFEERKFIVEAGGLTVMWITDGLSLERVQEVVHGLFGHLGDKSKRLPTAIGIMNCVKPVEWMVWLDSVFNVTALFLRQVIGHPDKLLDLLSCPLMVVNHPENRDRRSNRWLFPSLGEIYLYTAWPKHISKVADMVRRRGLLSELVAPESVRPQIRELHVDQYPYGDWKNSRVPEELGYLKEIHSAMDIYLNGRRLP